MTMFKSQSLIDQLEDVLDAEYRLMIAADFNGLSRILPVKEDLFAQIENRALDLIELRILRDKAERNQSMLDCVTRGVKSAIERIDRINAPGTNLKTYDGTGRRTNFGPSDHTVTRRA